MTDHNLTQKAIKVAQTSKALLLFSKGSDANLKKIEHTEYIVGNLSRGSFGIEPMLLALSLELALKAWITWEGKKPPYTHKLDKLFSELSTETQDRFRATYRAHFHFPGPDHFGLNIEIDDLLAHSKDAFTQWRYIHEMKHGSISTSQLEDVIELFLREFEKNFVRVSD